MIYFAYGPDLNPGHIAQRAPGHRSLGVARLADHWFAFPRYSPSDHSALIGLVPSPGGIVWGVLYDIPEEDVPILNHLHGYVAGGPPEYNDHVLKPVSVHLVNHAQPVAAEAYVPLPDNRNAQPSSAYMAGIIDGARYHGLPRAYLAALQSVRTTS
jgi:gamma-glutamylcyclotransferase